MVFFLTSKHQQNASNAGNRLNTADLPVELVLQIMERLSISDLLKARLTCIAFSRAGAMYLATRLKCLYIHPSVSSLRAVPLICEHPVFGPAIEQVIFLGPVTQTIAGNVPSKEDLSSTSKNPQPFRLYSRLCKLFSPWPKAFPTSKQCAATERENLLTVLERALTKLPKFKRLALQAYVEQPGFNQVSQAVVDSFANRYTNKNPYAHGDVPRLLDGHVLLHLLLSTTLSGESLIVDYEPVFPLSEHCELIFRIKTIPHDSQPFVSTLRDIKLVVNTDDYLESSQQQWLGACTDLLRLATELTSLRLEFCETDWGRVAFLHHHLRARDPLQQFLGCATWPKLKHLTLTAKTNDWDSRPVYSFRPNRPACEVGLIKSSTQLLFDLFLRRHASTLSQVHISNITFARSELADDVIPITKSTIRALQRANLEAWSFVINRFQHTPYCKYGRDDPVTSCSHHHACGRYFSMLTEDVTFEDFDAMAAEMGAALDEETQAWDFAKANRLD